MSGFERHRRSGNVIATLSGFEADLLRNLAAQLVELLRNERAVLDGTVDPLEALLDFTGPTTPPDDPVLARLFPSAYAEDDEAAGEFRRFTEGTLRDGKSAAAEAVIDGLTEAGLPDVLTEDGLVIDLELAPDEARTWMRSFTDVRLALATRLGIDDDASAEHADTVFASLPDEDPRAQAYDIYQWMGYLQETLVQALSGRR